MDDDQVKAAVLGAYGLKPWDIGGPVPLRVRLWRALTFAYRRGRAVNWREYEAAEAEARAAEAAMPDWMKGFADQEFLMGRLSEGLPDGLRFELRPGLRLLPPPADGE